mmetsp:Transcript_103607/g.332056  ORF Transcript_103607/g.332056 Transcript_103607/m.332056 type:complete len:298 (-) Transcript_103607:186-1079(-)
MVKSTRSYQSSASQGEFAEPDQTLIVFDWDDTLCPSCWIQDAQLSFFKAPPNEERYMGPLKQLERVVEGLLVTSLKLGHVVIVTNAQEPWVESSCKHFMPGLEPLLRRIPIRYARAVHAKALAEAEAEAQAPVAVHPAVLEATEELQRQAAAAPGGGPGMYSASAAAAAAAAADPSADLDAAPQRWKELVFRRELESFYSRYEQQSWKNVISIGDSVFERDAARVVISARPTKSHRCRTKTAKMLDEPTIEELIRQVKVLHDGISLIVKYDGNLDIEIDDKDIDFDMGVIERLVAES